MGKRNLETNLADSEPQSSSLTESGSRGIGGLSGLLRKTGRTVKRIAFAPSSEQSFYDYYEEFTQRETQESLGVLASDLPSIAFLKFSIMLECGMEPGHSLLDFCCGLDSMTSFALPYLENGHYLGMEISESALERTRRELLSQEIRENNATWLLETDSEFPLLGSNSVDMISAFTVFSHMSEVEVLRYLLGLKRILRPGGKLVTSFLLLEESQFARDLALGRSEPIEGLKCRSTTKPFVETVVEAAGLEVETCFSSDSESFEVAPGGEFGAFGQSVWVLKY